MLATRKLLQTFQIFRGLDGPDLDYLCSKSLVRRYSRRSVVLSAGREENQVCMLFEGRLEGIDFTIDGKEVALTAKVKNHRLESDVVYYGLAFTCDEKLIKTLLCRHTLLT